jgi:hypothetical protein
MDRTAMTQFDLGQRFKDGTNAVMHEKLILGRTHADQHHGRCRFCRIATTAAAVLPICDEKEFLADLKREG